MRFPQVVPSTGDVVFTVKWKQQRGGDAKKKMVMMSRIREAFC